MVRLPTVINDHERTVAVPRRQTSDEGGILTHAVGVDVSVIAIPIIETVNRLLGQTRMRAQLAAEGHGGGKGGLAVSAPTRSDGTYVQCPRAEPYAGTSATHIRHQGQAVFVELPAA